MTLSARNTLQRLSPLLAVGVVGLGVIAAAAALRGPSLATLAAGATLIGLTLVLLSDAAGRLVGRDPRAALARLLTTMLVRSGGAAAALLVAVLGLGCEPRATALVALPIYLALLGGEVLGVLAPAAPSDAAAASLPG